MSRPCSNDVGFRDRQVDGAPLWVGAGDILAEEVAEIKSPPGSDGGVDVEIALGDDLERRFAVLVTVGAADVEVVPVPRDAVPEVGFGAEGFPIEELVLDEAVNGFDVALPGVGLGWDVVVIGPQIADGGRQAAVVLIFEELGSVIGLLLDVAEVYAAESQMGTDVLGQQGAVGFAQLVGIAGEDDAAAF